MSQDLSVKKATAAPQRMADAMLRSLGGLCIQLRMTGITEANGQDELGITATDFVDLCLSPAVLRSASSTRKNTEYQELLLSASAVNSKVSELHLTSADALFAMVLAVVVDEKLFTIERVTSTEAFGRVYMYRLLLCANKNINS